jgi:hypothetical protein
MIIVRIKIEGTDEYQTLESLRELCESRFESYDLEVCGPTETLNVRKTRKPTNQEAK